MNGRDAFFPVCALGSYGFGDSLLFCEMHLFPVKKRLLFLQKIYYNIGKEAWHEKKNVGEGGRY